MSQSVLVSKRPSDNTNWESGVNFPRSDTQQSSVLTITKVRTGLYIMIYKGEDNWFVARCLQLPAAISQGRTREEAIRNIEEAISLVLEDVDEAFEVSSNLEPQWSHV